MMELHVNEYVIMEIKYVFACWCQFKKAEIHSNDFWVNVFKNGLGHLVHETLKLMLS